MQKILVVEDESVIRTALRRLLERNGYQISEAGSVQEAEASTISTNLIWSSVTCAYPVRPAQT